MTLAQIGALLTEIKAAISGAPALASENAELKLKLTASTAEVATLKSALAERDTALAAKDSEITTAKADATKAQDEAKAATDAKATAEKALADLQANPSEQARQIAAAAGVKPGERPKAEAGGVATQTITRAQFEALSHADRNAFMRSGGKLTN